VLVVAAGLLLLLTVLWVRVAWLQTALHGHFATRAEKNQQHREKILPRRGALLDRAGRTLAQDMRVSQIAVYRPQLRDPAAAARALAPVLRMDEKQLRRQLKDANGYSWIRRDVAPEVGARVRELRIEGIAVEDETRRHYPLGAAALEVIGRTNRDHVGVDGLEYQFEQELGGQTGWVTLVPTGRSSVKLRLPGADHRPARDGASLTLTLDAELQAITEHHLAAAVDSLDAVRGFAVFLDPWTGEILSAACYPHLPAGQAKNWNFTDQYEPGSTFKIVPAAAVLEERLARLDEYFTASTAGRVELVPGCWIKDSHGHEGYSFFDAMVHSSNIVLGKLGIRLGAERLHRYCTTLGFGSVTGLEFPGEASGKLRPLARWQPRSVPTISIGHELSVTPLQLALAYGAVANGGVLMEPQLMRELRAPDGRVLRRWQPAPSHRVFQEPTAAVLRQMLSAVVDSGTATAARVNGVHIGGKTGTAQKFDPVTKRYGQGMYIGSFAGLVPAEHPRLVGVVVIDEPRGGRYYGGQVAAPVFREIVLDLMRSPGNLLDAAPASIASRPPDVPSVVAPDLRLLPRREAQRRLRELGLRTTFVGEGARVLSQVPAAGQPVERGAAVLAHLEAAAELGGPALPDLTGLTAREALRQLSARSLTARIEGSGLVVRQVPPAGTALPIAVPVRVICQPARPVTGRAPDARVASLADRRP
jgi:cell division protein FtsI/penicillin-binding protein 2